MTSIQKTRAALEKYKADAIFVTKPKNIAYLTGFLSLSEKEREASLLVTKNKVIFYVPAMYETKARRLPLVSDGTITLSVNKERDYLLTSFSNELPQDTTVLYESHDLRVSELSNIQKTTPHLVLKNSEELIENLRIIKTQDEVELIKKAVSITDETYFRLIDFLQNSDYTQLTELDVSDKLTKISRELGGEGLGFSSIVASGSGSAEPHYETGTRKLQKSEVLLFDFGVKHNGYSGDLTRIVSLGPPSPEVKRIYDIVLDNLNQSVAACKPGVTAGSLYDLSNSLFKIQGLDKNFLHGLGHGIGLEMHETPLLRPGHTEKIEAGMTLTIEPGLYFENQFGIRIEDFVLVTENGCKILSKAPRNLFVI